MLEKTSDTTTKNFPGHSQSPSKTILRFLSLLPKPSWDFPVRSNLLYFYKSIQNTPKDHFQRVFTLFDQNPWGGPQGF